MRRKPVDWRILLPCALLFLASMACGGFQLRSSATPQATGQAAGATVVSAKGEQATPGPTTSGETATAAPAPSDTPSAAVPTGGLAVGATARVTANGGVNVRDKAGISGKQVGKVGTGQSVTVRGGPEQADNYTWWQIDNGAGLTGWVSMGPPDDPWLKPDSAAPADTPAATGGRLVDRAIKVGDTVQVTTEGSQLLTVRESPERDASAVARVLAGGKFTVKSGPEQSGGFTWWELEGQQVKGWAAEGDGTDRWLTPIEQ